MVTIPEGYTRSMWRGERLYIAQEEGTCPLMLINGKWVESDGGYKFPLICVCSKEYHNKNKRCPGYDSYTFYGMPDMVRDI